MSNIVFLVSLHLAFYMPNIFTVQDSNHQWSTRSAQDTAKCNIGYILLDFEKYVRTTCVNLIITREVSWMIHSARPTIQHYFHLKMMLFGEILKVGTDWRKDGSTDGRHMWNQWSLTVLTVGLLCESITWVSQVDQKMNDFKGQILDFLVPLLLIVMHWIFFLLSEMREIDLDTDRSNTRVNVFVGRTRKTFSSTASEHAIAISNLLFSSSTSYFK